MTKIKPTSIYLDDDSRERLEELAKSSERSKSEVMRGLINAASVNDREKRLTKLVAELAELTGIKTPGSREK